MSEESSLSTVLKNYQEQIQNELAIDKSNIIETQLKLPARKHFWVSKLIFHRMQYNDLTALYDKAIEDLADKMVNESPVAIRKQDAIVKAQQHDLCKKILNEQKEAKIIIDYLEKVEKIFSQATFDISNLAKLIALETT